MISTDRIVFGVIFSGLLIFAEAALPNPYYPSFPRDYTFDPPTGEKKYITEREAKKASRTWDKSGIVRIAIISDHNFDYKFWSGVQLIDIKTEETYDINAVKCYVSFCLYVGKVPIGRYFINTLYARSFDPAFMVSTYSNETAPIRNTMGSFEVKRRSITDLGIIGIYQGVEAGEGNRFLMSFLGNHPHIGKLYDELYLGYEKKHLTPDGKIYGWDIGEWKDSALKRAPVEPMFFADFSGYCSFGEGMFFPTVLGKIYALDRDKGYTQYNIDTLFMINTLLINGERWLAAGEHGRIYISQNEGKNWKTIDAFPEDEVVIKLFKKTDTLYALTASQKQKQLKLYTGAIDKLEFSGISKTGFKPRDKAVFVDTKMDSLGEIYINRKDLKAIKAHVLSDRLIVQLHRKLFKTYSFKEGKWKSLKPDKSIRDFYADNNSVYMVSETQRISEGSAQRIKGGAFGELPFDERAKLRTTSLYTYSSDLKKKLTEEDYFAISSGGLYAKADGSVVTVLRMIETPDHIKNPPQPRLYSIGDGSHPVAIFPIEDLDFYFDSDLLPMNGDTLLIDRVAPRVHRFRADGKVDSYRLYERAYEQLSRINKEQEV